MTSIIADALSTLPEEDTIVSSSSTTNDSIHVSESGTTNRNRYCSNLADMCITPEAPYGVTITYPGKPQLAKYYWRIRQNMVTQQGLNTLIYQSDLEPLLDNTVTTTGFVTSSEAEIDDEPRPNRGVFAINHKHKSIFSQELELKIKDLPRRRPRITIDRRMLEVEDD